MCSRRANVGLIGAGVIGRLHAQHLARRIPGACLAAIADIKRAAAEACAEECEVSAVYLDHRRLLEHPGTDAVAICTPPETHGEIIEDAAAVGKHIFCEKPIDCDISRIDSALAAVRRSGVKLQIGFNRRFDRNFHQAYETITSGGIGTVYILRITSRDPLDPGRDLFLDAAIHDFDMARYLTGSEATSLYVIAASTQGAGGGPDTAITALRFASGAIGTIDNSRRSVYGYDQRVEVFGSEGVLSLENERLHQVILRGRKGALSSRPMQFFMDRYADSYLAEMVAFVECVLEDTEPLVSGADGRAAVILALAAQRSFQEGRPVSLGESGP